jgi:hypothetical protein
MPRTAARHAHPSAQRPPGVTRHDLVPAPPDAEHRRPTCPSVGTAPTRRGSPRPRVRLRRALADAVHRGARDAHLSSSACSCGAARHRLDLAPLDGSRPCGCCWVASHSGRSPRDRSHVGPCRDAVTSREIRASARYVHRPPYFTARWRRTSSPALWCPRAGQRPALGGTRAHRPEAEHAGRTTPHPRGGNWLSHSISGRSTAKTRDGL